MKAGAKQTGKLSPKSAAPVDPSKTGRIEERRATSNLKPGSARLQAETAQARPGEADRGQRTKEELKSVQPRVVTVESLEIEQADFGLRFAASMFDFLIMLIVVLAATLLLTELGGRRGALLVGRVALIVIVTTTLLNFVILAGRSGQTIGKKILGITIVKDKRQRLGYAAAALRHLVGYPLSAIPFMLGFLSILWDRNQRGWHDRIAGTIVIKSV